MNSTISILSRGARLGSLVLAVFTGLTVTALAVPTEAWAAPTTTRSVSGYQAVALEGPMTVKVSLADQESVTVEGEAKATAAVDTTVVSRDGMPTLLVKPSGTGTRGLGDVVVHVRGPQFKALSLSGSGDVEAQLSNQPALKLSLAGSGDVKVKGLTTHQLDLSLAGSGDVRVQGATQKLAVSLAGSGDVWLDDLSAEEAQVRVAGSGDVQVRVQQRLKVSIAGSGDVRVSGPVKDISSTVVGSGRLIRP